MTLSYPIKNNKVKEYEYRVDPEWSDQMTLSHPITIYEYELKQYYYDHNK